MALYLPPAHPPSSMLVVSVLSPSIDLPPFMSCLMKRESKKEICPSETSLDQCDVFIPNEPASPHFSASQAVGRAGGRASRRRRRRLTMKKKRE